MLIYDRRKVKKIMFFLILEKIDNYHVVCILSVIILFA